jgi:hypothetical protein
MATPTQPPAIAERRDSPVIDSGKKRPGQNRGSPIHPSLTELFDPRGHLGISELSAQMPAYMGALKLV